MKIVDVPNTQAQLLARVHAIAGMTVGQSACQYQLDVPNDLRHHKGWFGHLIEKVLGASAGSKPIPDFPNLGIELKTLPIGKNGRPAESTFVASISLLGIAKECWETSVVKKKLSHVLWLPIEDDKNIPFSQRRIGMGFLWHPTPEQEAVLKKDWQELANLITMGQIDEISAHLGDALQVRPKAANAKVLTAVLNRQGQQVKTLPRGFYLRASFTSTLFI